MGQYFHINPMEWPMTMENNSKRKLLQRLHSLLSLHHVYPNLGLKTQFGTKLVKLFGVDYPLQEMLQI